MSWWTSREIHPKTKSKFVVVFGGVFYLPNIKSLNKPKIDFDTKEFRLLNHKFNYPGNGTWQPITMKFVDMNGMGRQQDHFDTGAFLWQVLNNTGYTYPYIDNSQFRDPHFRNVKASGENIGDEFGGGHHISTKIKLDGDGKSWKTITTPEKSSTIANSFGLGLENVADFEYASVSKQRISIYQLAPFTGNENLQTETNTFTQSNNKEFSVMTPLGAIITECWHLVNPIVKSVGWGDLAYDSDDLIEYELGIVYDWAIMDRTQIGKPFNVTAQPYQQFMKTLFVDNEEAITDRKLQVAKFDINAKTVLRKDGSLDLDGDNKISDLERKLSQDPKIIAEVMDGRTVVKEKDKTDATPVNNPGSDSTKVDNSKPASTVTQEDSLNQRREEAINEMNENFGTLSDRKAVRDNTDIYQFDGHGIKERQGHYIKDAGDDATGTENFVTSQFEYYKLRKGSGIGEETLHGEFGAFPAESISDEEFEAILSYPMPENEPED